MGFYIETGTARNKARVLVDKHKAKLEVGRFFDPSGKSVGVCVVDNGTFEAAGVAFSEREADAFNNRDGRPRVWLSMDRAEVVKLCPYVEKELPKLDEVTT